MGNIVKTLFGGNDKSSQKGQIAQNAAATEFIKAQGVQGRYDILGLSPAAEDNRNAGYQGALDVLSQTIPQQIGAYTSGNTAAQAAILGGNPSITTINPNTSFASQQLPQHTSIVDALTGENFEEKNKVSGIKTDADLLLAASKGDIPGLSPEDRQWYSKLLQETPDFANSSRYITDPKSALASVVGSGSGLTPENQLKMQNLLNNYSRML